MVYISLLYDDISVLRWTEQVYAEVTQFALSCRQRSVRFDGAGTMLTIHGGKKWAYRGCAPFFRRWPSVHGERLFADVSYQTSYRRLVGGLFESTVVLSRRFCMVSLFTTNAEFSH